LVFLSTHSSHDNVGLLRFCLFLEDSNPTPSSCFIGGVLKVEFSVAVGETDVYIAVGSGPIGSMVLLVHAPGARWYKVQQGTEDVRQWLMEIMDSSDILSQVFPQSRY
jgi:hypothetical protein